MSHIRRWILLTLSHVEQLQITIAECVSRIQRTFSTSKIVACTEAHSEGGHHYHFAIENSDASRFTAADILRKKFVEFEGRGIDIKFHKCWATMLQYVTKEDPSWRDNIFGDYTAEDAERELSAKRSKTANAVTAIRQHIESGGTIASLAYNDTVAPFMLRSAGSVQKFAELVSLAKKHEPTLDFIQRMSRDIDEVSTLALLDLITTPQRESLKVFVRQLQGRQPRQPQLYCVGPPNCGKTYLFQILAQHTSCFIPCLENSDRAFAGYDDRLHDWIFINDFHDNVRFQLLSNLMEGAPMKLNGYGTQSLKTKNCPVVFTANELPAYKNLDQSRSQALLSRIQRVPFGGPTPSGTLDIVQICAICAFLLINE